MAKSIIILLSITFSILVFTQCKSAKLEDNLELMGNSDHFYIGSGGGFSGKMVNYYFLENGHIIKTNSFKKTSEQLKQKISKKEFKKFKAQLMLVLVEDTGLSANMSNYIGLKKDNKKTRAIWEKGVKSKFEYQDIYSQLMTIIKQK